jgi:hypothetical protein
MAGRLGQDVAELAARGDARLNHKWCGDGTEIGTDEGKLYLASVMDAASRRILGFTLSEHHDAAAAYGAVAMAVTVRGGQVPGVIMHTGQGSEYTARAFQAACQRVGIAQSMGRPGDWTTRSSNPGTPPWSSNCAGRSTSPPSRLPGPRWRPGSRTTTPGGGTRPARKCPPARYKQLLAASQEAAWP